MSSTQHVLDFLDSDQPPPVVSTCVLFGSERYLKSMALVELRRRLLASERQGEDVPVHTFDGAATTWADVADELSTLSLFGGGGRRIVIVDDADPFVSQYREKLEAYAAKSHKASVLVLVVDSWSANTTLYKTVDAKGLQIECRPPLLPPKKRDVDAGRVQAWLTSRAARAHEATLPRDAAKLLLDLVGAEFGLLDQELAKLAVLAGRGGKITTELVQEHAGAWRQKTTWDMVDAALDGNAAEALKQVDQLIQAGQEPIGLMAGIATTLRRFAAAIRIYEEAERRGGAPQLRGALIEGGTNAYFADKAERQLKQIGRRRAGQFLRWLLEIDLAQKSSHSAPARARWQIEQLILRLARQAGPQAGAARRVES